MILFGSLLFGKSKYERHQNKKECNTCKHRQTMNCPNSYYCYAREDKPYWEEKK